MASLRGRSELLTTLFLVLADQPDVVHDISSQSKPTVDNSQKGEQSVNDTNSYFGVGVQFDLMSGSRRHSVADGDRSIPECV